MDLGHFLLAFAIILIAARFFGELAVSFKIPAVIGELFAGVLLGPSVINLIQPNEVWQILSEIGVVLLLFEVGLETDFYRLTRTGKKPYLVAMTGFCLPFIFAFLLSYYLFHLSLLVALFIAGTLTATSIGITVRVLNDLKQRQTHEAQIIIGAAVLDDILGVLLLAFLYDFAMSRTISWSSTLHVGAYIILFMLLAPIVAKMMITIVNYFDQKRDSPGLLLTLTISVVMLFSYLAHVIGAPVILGGFAAGLAVSRQFGLTIAKQLKLPFTGFLNKMLKANSHLADNLEHQVKPVIQMYTPIFFVMVGASLNLGDVPWHSPFVWLLTTGLFIVAFVGKLISGFIIKEPRALQTIIGISMVPRGEVGLIFAKLGLLTQIFTAAEYAALILVVTLTTFLPPFLLRWRYSRLSSL